MGGGGASFFKFKPFNFRFFFFLILIVLYAEANDTRETPPPSPNPNATEKTSSSFKPGMAVVVAVLTTMFSLTFLLLLYIKHCNGGNIDTGGGNIATSRAVPPLTGRKNSGIDRSIVESLPIFRFGALRGQKEGLDCAVCLTKFEAAEVLRLLPKCKHAFHVECVDTWLDAHSTCPLCRYRVDPEDILLVQDPANAKILRHNNQQQCLDIERGRNSNHEIEEYYRRRHSSVGESESERQSKRTTSSSFRRSLDSATSTKKNESVVGIGVGCFVRPRKDGMLLAQEIRDRTSVERRLEHRIIVSSTPHRRHGGVHHNQRWSDVQASDLLYLTSEMMRWNTRGVRRVVNNVQQSSNDDEIEMDEDSWNGRGIINSRSVSEITGLSRFVSYNNNEQQQQRHMEREEGLVSRWLAWISRSRSQPAVR